MSPVTDVSREAMDGLADAILGQDGPTTVEDDDGGLPVDEQVDGLATACHEVWAATAG